MTEVKLFDSIEEANKVLEERIPRLVRVDGSAICVVRLTDKLIAFRNECPHMGEQLHRGVVNYLNEIICPLHGYRFNLIHGDEAARKCKPLHFMAVQVNAKGEVFLKI